VISIASGSVPDEPHVALGEPVRQALRRHAPLFLGAQDTTNLLTRASADVPDIVKDVLRALPLQRVAEVLRRLVSEGVSIRNLRDILEALSEIAQRDKDVHALTEFTRVALRRQVSHQVAPQGRLGALMLQPQLEELLRQAVRVSGGVSQLALDPETARRVCDAIVGSMKKGQGLVVHTAECKQAARSRRVEPEQWLDVEWDRNTTRLFLAALRVTVTNRRGVLAKVASEIAEAGSNIDSISMEEDRAVFTAMLFVIEVANREHLARVMRALRRLPEVEKLARARE